MPSLTDQVVLDAVNTVALGSPILLLGAGDSEVPRILRTRGWDIREVNSERLATGQSGGDDDGNRRSLDGEATCPVVIVGPLAAAQGADAFARALARLSRLSSDAVVVVAPNPPDPVGAGPKAPWGREWWRERWIESGLRRHPLAGRIEALGRLEEQAAGSVFVMQVLPLDARAALTANIDGRWRSQDLLRTDDEAARPSRLRYEWAAGWLRPGDRVVDLDGKSGAGPALLWDLSEAGRVSGVVRLEAQRAYAVAMYAPGRSGLDFAPSAPAWENAQGGSAVDAMLETRPLSAAIDADRLGARVARALRPGGRLFLTLVATNGSTSVTAGDTAARLESWMAACRQSMLIEGAWCCFSSAGPGAAALCVAKWPCPEVKDASGIHWFTIVTMRDPLPGSSVAYEERIFPAREGGDVPTPIAFGRDFENPWLVHSMVMGPYRARSRAVLADLASRVSAAAPPGSADEGAALCVLAYQLLEGAPAGIDGGEVASRAAAYLGRAPANPHAARWRVSLQYVLALLAQQDGRPGDAEQLFRACAGMDFEAFSPHLATKCSEAAFHAGRLAWLRGDLDQAEADWRAVFGLLGRIEWAASDVLLVNPERPAPFEFGDGMREMVLVVDNAARCANGLRMLAHRRAGRVVHGLGWDRSFQTIQGRLLEEIGRRGGEILAWQSQGEVLRRELEALRHERETLRHDLAALETARGDLEAELEKTREGWKWMVRRLSAHLMKNVVIFGAGDGGRRVWECVCRGARAHVLFFVDNDPRKHGLRFLSADVRAPEALGEGGFDLVLVASIYADEITAQLDSLGVPRDLVRVFELSAGDEALDRAVAAALPVPAVPAVSSHGVVARVGIFGTGQGGMRVWEALMGLDHIEPAWFCDNDVRKQGRPFLWLEVIPPAEIPRRLADYVIVASMYREPITRQLIGLGVPGERILTPSVTTNVDTIRRELASALPARTLIA